MKLKKKKRHVCLKDCILAPELEWDITRKKKKFSKVSCKKKCILSFNIHIYNTHTNFISFYCGLSESRFIYGAN